MQSPNSLVASILKGRYYQNTNILNAGHGYKPSFIWKSLLEGRDLLKKGLRFLIGDGNHTSAWLDPWLPTHPARPPQFIAGQETSISSVGDLLNERRNGWNMELVNQCVVEEDIALLRKLKLSTASSPDFLGWNYTENGIYTVKSGYWLARHLPEYGGEVQPPPGNLRFKAAIWKLNTAPKLRHFLWRMLSNAMPIGTILNRRGITTDSQCRRCCSEEETMDHLFFTCSYAQAVWRGTQRPIPEIHDPFGNFNSRFQAILENHNNHDLPLLTRQLPVWILWSIWKSRNLLVYQKKNSCWYQDIQKAIIEAKEWLPSTNTPNNESQRFNRGLTDALSEWKCPATGYVKCNYDCTYRQHDNSFQAAWIIRDDSGFYHGATQSKGYQCSSPLEAELQALLMSMQAVWTKGYRKVIFEGDNQTVHKLINGEKTNFYLHNWIRDIRIWQKKFESTEFQWVSRKSNKVADKLAKEPLPLNSSYVYHFYIPTCITTVLHEDHSVSN